MPTRVGIGKPPPPLPASGIGAGGSAVATLSPEKPTSPFASLKETVKPPPAAPKAAPAPASLAQAGFQGTMQDFNHRVKAAHDAYVGTRGTPPSPGLVLDVVRSVLPPQVYHQLFVTLPQTLEHAQSLSVINTHSRDNPDDMLVTDAHGRTQPDNPIRRLIGLGAGVSVGADPERSLLDQAKAQYPILRKYKFAFKQSAEDQSGRGLEFYSPSERDSFAKGKPAIEVFGSKATPLDVLGDAVSHYLARGVDPKLTSYYNQFLKSLTPEQQKFMHDDQFKHAQEVEGEQRPYKTWLKLVGLPAYFRGYAFDQWPDAKSLYTPEQTRMFDKMRTDLGIGSAGVGANAQVAAPELDPAPVMSAQDAAKKHPYIPAGFLPIPNLGSLYSGLTWVDKHGADPNLPVVHQGTTLGEYRKELELAKARVAGTEGTQSQAYADLIQSARAVTSITQAQKELNGLMHTDLPVTGYLNKDWLNALSRYTRSADYFYRSTQQLSQQAGFGSDTEAFKNTWKAQQDFARKHGLLAHFALAVPLPLWRHHIGFGTFVDYWHYLSSNKSPSDPSFWSPTTALHALTKNAGLALSGVGGTVTQGKADLAAGGEFINAIAPTVIGGKGTTYEEAKVEAARVLREHPSWLRVFYPDLADHPQGVVGAVDSLSNVVGDLILLRKPALTGERIAAGDLAAARSSGYVNASAHWAYQDLTRYGKDGVGRATSHMAGGQGAARLAAWAAPLIAKGKLTEEQFTEHLAELTATGKTSIQVGDGVKVIEGPALTELYSRQLPTPGKPGGFWQHSRSAVREWLDHVDQTLGSADPAAAGRAQSLILFLRSQVSHATIPTMGYFDRRLGENLYNFVLKHKLGDIPTDVANQLESRLVRAQATENIAGIQKVQRDVEQLYHEKFPGRAVPDGDPFKALLSTESATAFHLPSGGDPMVGILGWTRQLNTFLNRVATVQTRFILPSGSLFWKHAVGGDLLRRIAGNGFSWGSPELKMAKREIDQLARGNPAVERQLGAYLERETLSEARYMLNRGAANKESFQTGEHFASRPHMAAAGGALRRLLTDPALTAYRSSRSNVAPLVGLISSNKDYQALFHAARKEAAAQGIKLSVGDYAKLLGERYKQFEDAAVQAGLADPWGQALQVLRSHRGAKSDAALGKFLAGNKVDWSVTHGLVETRGSFDDVTGRLIGNVVMAPNKWHRGGFAKAVLYRSYAEFRKAGVEPSVALQIASDLGAKLVKYHMLDFANRLQVEQDLRWVSFFATKHRLYWKWVLGTFLRRPGYAAAINDFKEHLDSHGNLGDFTVWGHKVTIPAARLAWVPGKDYSEISGEAMFISKFVSSGFNTTQAWNYALSTGNGFTRSDTAIQLGFRLASVYAGRTPATYGAAVAGLRAKDQAAMNRAMNEYANVFYHQHGHYPAEADTVKHVLLGQLGSESWRSYLPLPVASQYDRTKEHSLLREYMMLPPNPKQRRDFLDKHPHLQELFGIYQTPRIYLHNKTLFQRYTGAYDTYRQARADILTRAKQHGYSADMEKEKRALDKAFGAFYDRLLVEDARSFGVKKALYPNRIPDGQTVAYGPWGRLASADPNIDPRHILNALFPNLKLKSPDVYGDKQKALEAELRHLNTPEGASTYTDPQDLKRRKREILAQLEPLRAYPSDALGKVKADYQKVVNSYWDEVDRRFALIAGGNWHGHTYPGLPHDQRDQAYADMRSWRDEQDHTHTVDGVKFPSPVRMAWGTLDPQTRLERLAYLAAKTWANLTSYEKSLLLDKPVSPTISDGYDALVRAETQYRKTYPGQGIDKQALNGLAHQIDKAYPGFYTDWVTHAQAPRLENFQDSVLYRDMPDHVRAEFDSVIAGPAKKVIHALKDKNYRPAELTRAWRAYIEGPIKKWLADPAQAALRTYLSAFGPDFLNELVAV